MEDSQFSKRLEETLFPHPILEALKTTPKYCNVCLRDFDESEDGNYENPQLNN